MISSHSLEGGSNYVKEYTFNYFSGVNDGVNGDGTRG